MSDERRGDSGFENGDTLNDLLSAAFMRKKKDNDPKSGLDIIIGTDNRTPSDQQTPFHTDVKKVQPAEDYPREDFPQEEYPEEYYPEDSSDDEYYPEDDEEEYYSEEDDEEEYYSEEDDGEEEYYSEEDDDEDDYSDYDDQPEEDEEEEESLSIEEMVAKAMAGSKNNMKYVERVATEEDAVSDEELARMLSEEDLEMYDSLVGDDEDDYPTKWYKNKKMIIAFSILGALIVLMGVLVGTLLHYYNLMDDTHTVYDIQPGVQPNKGENDTVDADDYEDWLAKQLSGIEDKAMSNEKVTNILIIAEDLRDTTGESRGNTDVMILVSINKEQKTVTLSSFMRDIYCPISGFYSARLNSAYAKGGPETLLDTLKANFGVVIDKYVLVNFYSFMDVVDAIGGVEADVTDAEAYAMIDPLAEQNDIMHQPRSTDRLPSGGHYLLNANQTLAYSRIRYNVGNDFGRTNRQRQVIFTILKKAKDLSPFQIKDLADTILENDGIKTNLTEGEVASLLLNSFTYMEYTQQQLQIPADGTWYNMTVRSDQVLGVNFIKNAQLLQETIYGSTNIDADPNSGEYTNTEAPPSTEYEPSTDQWQPPQTQAPVYTDPPATEPPAVYTDPPATEPPATEPPVTDPPETESSTETEPTATATTTSASSQTTPPPTTTTPPPTTTTKPTTTPKKTTTPKPTTTPPPPTEPPASETPQQTPQPEE